MSNATEDTSVEAWVAQVVAAAPPPTPEQAERLAALLRNPSGGDAT